jgi:hypothetical protein
MATAGEATDPSAGGDPLPEAIQSEISRLLIQQVSVDDIVAHLRRLSGVATIEEVPSRSALGRYAVSSKRLRERLLKSREIASAVVRDIGDAPGSQQMAVLIELLQTYVFDLLNKLDDDESLSPKQVGEIAKGLKDITLAARGNIEFIRAAEARAAAAAKTEAATVAETVARERGISVETIEAIKRGIFGVQA